MRVWVRGAGPDAGLDAGWDVGLGAGWDAGCAPGPVAGWDAGCARGWEPSAATLRLAALEGRNALGRDFAFSVFKGVHSSVHTVANLRGFFFFLTQSSDLDRTTRLLNFMLQSPTRQ